ncbi:GSTT1 transferase, partial [Polypterus senegalus]|nr:glutathione S-transferase theta-2 [Polypterus senegalus]MBN3289647.1 GSTT1 transferase [Polypterus senegalus]
MDARTRPLEVYVDLMSQPCRALLLFLRHNHIPHTVKNVLLHRGEQKTPEFTKLNPMQKVPVIVDNGFVLTESDAILKYLATTYKVPHHWYPQDPKIRARINEYTSWHQTNTRPHAARVFILEVLMPRMTGNPPDAKKVERALADLSETLDKLESVFLKRQPFLCGDEITLADLLAICELMQPLGSGRDVLKDRPKLDAWRERIKSAMKDTFDEVHMYLYRLRDKARL